MSLHYALSTSIKPIKPIELPRARSEKTGEKWESVTQWLSDELRELFAGISSVDPLGVEEIRLRIGQPLLLRTSHQEIFINGYGDPTSQAKAYRVRQNDLIETLERMTNSSLYAVNEELKQGYLSLPGGHRVGVVGEAIMQGEDLQTLKHISSINIRLAREVRGSALEVLPLLMGSGGLIRHTLVLSAPRAGKTTFLRELICLLSEGVPEFGLKGQTVGVVDERNELAGMWQGIPSYNLGPRTDVLDSCPKAKGIGMLVRAMAPDVIAVDELGHSDDVSAVTDALRTGVRILGTAHAESMEEACSRPTLRILFEQKVFERIVVLSRRKGPGTVMGVFDMSTGGNLEIMDERLC